MYLSELPPKKQLATVYAQIDKMNSELADLAHLLERTPPFKKEITAAAYFQDNFEFKEGTGKVSAKKSTGTSKSDETFETQYVPWQLSTVGCANFKFLLSIKVDGDIFYVGDSVVAVVGNAEIPFGTTVDATLVVKGSFIAGENCQLLKDVKALKNIVIGQDSIVHGNLRAGGKITIGSSCVVHGGIEADGDIEIDENTVIEGILRSKASIILSQSTEIFRTVYAERGLCALRAM